MTDERLKEIAARCEKATQGPWRSDEDLGEDAVVRAENEPDWDKSILAQYLSWQDAAFIAAARQDVPDLCAELIATRAREASLLAKV